MENAFGAKDMFTPYGDGPLKIDGMRGLVYGPPPALQAECDTALADFAAYVENTGRHLLVVTMPLLGEWSDKYDRDSKARTHLAETIRGALKGRSATFWDAWSRLTLPAQDYTDAVHLRGSAARLHSAIGQGNRLWLLIKAPKFRRGVRGKLSHCALPFAPTACSLNHACILENDLKVLRRPGGQGPEPQRLPQVPVWIRNGGLGR